MDDYSVTPFGDSKPGAVGARLCSVHIAGEAGPQEAIGGVIDQPTGDNPLASSAESAQRRGRALVRDGRPRFDAFDTEVLHGQYQKGAPTILKQSASPERPRECEAPFDPSARGFYLACMGRHEEALAFAERARRLDPVSLNAQMNLGMILYLARRYDEAVSEITEALELAPDFGPAHVVRGRVYVAKGMPDRAVEELERAQGLMGSRPDVVTPHAYVLARAGRHREARAMLDGLGRISRPRDPAPVRVAIVHIGLGETDRAFEWLEKALEARDWQMAMPQSRTDLRRATVGSAFCCATRARWPATVTRHGGRSRSYRPQLQRPRWKSRMDYIHLMRRTASVAISLLLATAVLQAQVAAPGLWEKVDALPPGSQMTITLKSGVHMEGAFQDSSPQDLALRALTGGEQRVPKADVQGVVGEKKDSVVDGLLLGAAIGAGSGALWGYSRSNFLCKTGCALTWGVILGTPVGAVVGWLRDRKHNQTEVLYQAP